DGTRRHELRADAADRGADLLRLWIPVRPAGVAAFRRLSRAGDIRACHRDAAVAQARLLRALDRRRAGPGRDQARRAVRPADVAVPRHGRRRRRLAAGIDRRKRLHHLRAEYRRRHLQRPLRCRIRRASVPCHLPGTARRQADRNRRPATDRETEEVTSTGDKMRSPTIRSAAFWTALITFAATSGSALA